MKATRAAKNPSHACDTGTELPNCKIALPQHRHLIFSVYHQFPMTKTINDCFLEDYPCPWGCCWYYWHMYVSIMISNIPQLTGQHSDGSQLYVVILFPGMWLQHPRRLMSFRGRKFAPPKFGAFEVRQKFFIPPPWRCLQDLSMAY